MGCIGYSISPTHNTTACLSIHICIKVCGVYWLQFRLPHKVDDEVQIATHYPPLYHHDHKYALSFPPPPRIQKYALSFPPSRGIRLILPTTTTRNTPDPSLHHEYALSFPPRGIRLILPSPMITPYPSHHHHEEYALSFPPPRIRLILPQFGTVNARQHVLTSIKVNLDRCMPSIDCMYDTCS